MLHCLPCFNRIFYDLSMETLLVCYGCDGSLSSPLKATLLALPQASLPSHDSQENINDLAAGALSMTDIGH